MLILKPSKTHGVGVFTTEGIKKNMQPPLFEKNDWKRKKRCVGYQRRYCTSKWAPMNYHRMSIGWYLNHSNTPNISSEMKGLRYIKAGEELTIDYATLE